jgi:hypothetical protein
MPRGDKSKYTDKQQRQAEHIEEAYEDRGALACSPKADPCVMRVPSALLGKETLDERQEAPSGADHQEAA